MTKWQRNAFEQIAINQYSRAAGKTIKALIDAGVVECSYMERRDALGLYKISVYSVPRKIHMQWCEWCSEQPENR